MTHPESQVRAQVRPALEQTHDTPVRGPPMWISRHNSVRSFPNSGRSKSQGKSQLLRPPGSPCLLRHIQGLTGFTGEGHLVIRIPRKGSLWLPFSELTVLLLRFQNIQQNHLGTELEWRGWELGFVIRTFCLLSVPKLTARAMPFPARADNGVFNYYNYHLNNWVLPQIIKMRFGSSSPVSPLNFKSDGELHSTPRNKSY